LRRVGTGTNRTVKRVLLAKARGALSPRLYADLKVILANHGRNGMTGRAL